jgi:hypothetical protein
MPVPTAGLDGQFQVPPQTTRWSLPAAAVAGSGGAFQHVSERVPGDSDRVTAVFPFGKTGGS